MKVLLLSLLSLCLFNVVVAGNTEHYVRFSTDELPEAYGMMVGDEIIQLDNHFLHQGQVTEQRFKRTEVKLLPPTEPRAVFAVGMNFASHASSSSQAPPPLFLKLPSSIVAHNQDIQRPKDARNVHFEGEMVLVIGKQTRDVNEKEAAESIFGVTMGNDLTERSWQGEDLQWLRAKASDGFGPVGPVVATGLNYNNLLLTTRLNGAVVQQENTKNMIHKPVKVVSYLSQYFTLEPGDLIFMGTPGQTSSVSEGDVVTVTLEDVGTLRNKIH